MGLRRGIVSVFAIALVAGVVSGCSVDRDSKLWRFPNTASMKDRDYTATPVVETRMSRLPWETWPTRMDLLGVPIRHPQVLEGDILFEGGDRRKALEVWQKIKPRSLPPNEQEAITLRIASTNLAMDKAPKALAAISDFFRTSGRDVEDVDTRFSLILAYAYGRKGDFDQSFAWFSRVNRLSVGGGMSEAAGKGAGLLLRGVPDDGLIEVGRVWATDSWVSSLVGRERMRRERQGGIVKAQGPGAFWEQGGDGTVLPTPGVHGGKKSVVAVFLPLTGKYAQLGASLKNGIELATEADRKEGRIELLYKDTKGDVTTSEQLAKQVVETNQASVILGPLLSDPALAVSEIARQRNFPVVSFSKRTDFSTGSGVFRLGATAESQVRSLVETTRKNLGVSRFGLLVPETQQGFEYVNSFRTFLQAEGIDLAYETSFAPGDFNGFAQIALELETAGVDCVFVPDEAASAARIFSSLSPEMRKRIRPLGIASWDGSRELSNSKTVLEGAVFVSPFFAGSDRELVRRFVAIYKSRYGKNPDFLAAQGFDGATMVLGALRRQQADGIGFIEAFGQIDQYDGLTGRIGVDSRGEVVRELPVVELFQGKTRELLDGKAPPVSNVVVMRGNQKVPEISANDRSTLAPAVVH